MPYRKFLYAYNIFHYLLAGDFFGNNQKYIEFIDCVLASERPYDRFLQYVKADNDVNSGEYQSCGYSYDRIYGHLPGQFKPASAPSPANS